MNCGAHAVLQVRPHQCQMQQGNRLVYLAGYAVFDAPKDGICPLGFQGTLLAHIEHPRITFYRSVLQPLLSHFIFVPGVSPGVESIFWSLLCCVMPLIVAQCSNVPEHAAEPLIL